MAAVSVAPAFRTADGPTLDLARRGTDASNLLKEGENILGHGYEDGASD